jgi:hypothetical protein
MRASPVSLLLAACAATAVQPSVSADATDAAVSDSFRSALVQHGVNATDPDHSGIWKAATPPNGSMHGELGNNDPLGLSAGARIWADCSINWVDPDSGKRYCFSSATSLVVFLETPHAYLARAVRNWDGANSTAGHTPAAH